MADDGRDDFRRSARRLVGAWLALIALMLASLGCAYLRLGAGNLVAGLAIAAVKAAIVVWLFMELRRASPTTRIAAAAGFVTLLLLMTLSFADYATRRVEPARWQPPQQISPLFDRQPKR